MQFRSAVSEKKNKVAEEKDPGSGSDKSDGRESESHSSSNNEPDDGPGPVLGPGLGPDVPPVVHPIIPEIEDPYELPDDPEWRRERAEAMPPLWDPETKYIHAVVTNPAAKTGDIIGKLATIHQGTARETVTFYCRLHQCTPPPKLLRKSPSMLDMRMWFAHGQEMGRGKDHKKAHMKMLADLYREHMAK